MDGHGGDAGLLQDLRKLHAVAAAHVPAPAELGGHRYVDRLHHCLHDPGGGLRLAHQGGAIAVIDDLPHGAAHVDVQHVGTGALNGDLGRFRHADGVVAEDLHRRRMLPGELLQQGEGLFVLVAQSLGGDQLRAGIARTQL